MSSKDFDIDDSYTIEELHERLPAKLFREVMSHVDLDGLGADVDDDDLEPVDKNLQPKVSHVEDGERIEKSGGDVEVADATPFEEVPDVGEDVDEDADTLARKQFHENMEESPRTGQGQEDE